MISAIACSATPRPPLRAREPQDPVLRAGLAAVRWKRGNPYCDRTTLRVAQRFAFGLAKPAVARAEGTDEAAIDALLAQDGFAEVIASWHDILDESSPEFMARLEKLCRIALTNALAEWDVGAALFAQRELGQGRDPAQTLARRVRAQAKRTPAPPRAPEPPGPPPLPNPAYDPLDALVQRSAAGLRQAVVLEQAILTGATRHDRRRGDDGRGPQGAGAQARRRPSRAARRSRCGMGNSRSPVTAVPVEPRPGRLGAAPDAGALAAWASSIVRYGGSPVGSSSCSSACRCWWPHLAAVPLKFQQLAINSLVEGGDVRRLAGCARAFSPPCCSAPASSSCWACGSRSWASASCA